MSDAKIVYDLDVDLPNLPKGEPIQIPGLGTFENGGSYEITQEQADAYRSYNGRQEPVYDEETDELIGTEWSDGSTLLEASKSMYGVEVSTHKTSGGGNTPPQNNTPPSGGDNKDGGDS